jgi:hypothetical protein
VQGNNLVVTLSDWSGRFVPSLSAAEMLRFAHNIKFPLKHCPYQRIFNSFVRMSHHELRSSKRSSKRSKTSDAGGVFTIARITDQLKTIEVEAREEDITQLIRSCILNPSRL